MENTNVVLKLCGVLIAVSCMSLTGRLAGAETIYFEQLSWSKSTSAEQHTLTYKLTTNSKKKASKIGLRAVYKYFNTKTKKYRSGGDRNMRTKGEIRVSLGSSERLYLYLESKNGKKVYIAIEVPSRGPAGPFANLQFGKTAFSKSSSSPSSFPTPTKRCSDTFLHSSEKMQCLKITRDAKTDPRQIIKVCDRVFLHAEEKMKCISIAGKANSNVVVGIEDCDTTFLHANEKMQCIKEVAR